MQDMLTKLLLSCLVVCQLDVVMAGDDVKKKKPDPMIYNLAKVLPAPLPASLLDYSFSCHVSAV